MSKITIPLLMIFAAIGVLALAKLDHDGSAKRRHLWPTKNAPIPPEIPVAEPLPIELPDHLSGEEFERETNRELANIRLLPLSDDASPVSFLWPSGEDQKPAHPELLDYAQRDSFSRWKSFTDEYLGFFYPDAPGIRVELVASADAVPLFGETMLPADLDSFRRYRITAGDSGTLCLISLCHADWFDDAERAPHPEIFHRFTRCGGGLMRTSFTDQGQVRRVELLGDGIRISLLDWPHLAVHQDIYLRIAAGIILSRPHARLGDLTAAAKERYGFEGKLGFLDHGISTSELDALVGQTLVPDEAGTTLNFLGQRGGESIQYHLSTTRGMFAGFGPGWREVTRVAPDDGSIRWMREKSDYRAGDAGGIGYNLGALTDSDAQMIFDRFVELAPSSGPDGWRQLCDTIANLAQHGLRDPRVTGIARAKLESPGIDPSPSLLALESCASDLAKAAIAEHIISRFTSPELPPDTLEHFYSLIAYLGKSYPASAQLVDRALGHPSELVRELGFQYCSWLPDKFAIPHLEAGLQDTSTEVRRRCASAFALGHGDPARHPEILRICLSKEDDEQVKIHLREALQRLGERSE